MKEIVIIKNTALFILLLFLWLVLWAVIRSEYEISDKGEHIMFLAGCFSILIYTAGKSYYEVELMDKLNK